MDQHEQSYRDAIFFVGDPHGLTAWVSTEIAPLRPAAVVFLGDFDLSYPLEREVEPLTEVGTQVWWIHGNHDTDRIEYYSRLFRCQAPLRERNLHAQVRVIAGLRIAGLGGVFKGRVWKPEPGTPSEKQMRARTRKAWLHAQSSGSRSPAELPLALRDAIFWEDYEALWGKQADVLVCHEAPTSHRHGFEAIDDLAESMGVKVVVHGHHHTDYQATIRNGRIKVVGVGLAGVVALAPSTKEISAVLQGVRSNRSV
ncbi:MAG TPA: metallophosphoesterase family protein [Candidatus Binataceae bacterium]|nr:metallophosphoesterase family protein [Candidatus Binataceae bacterium]